jgi:hypothetical protein
VLDWSACARQLLDVVLGGAWYHAFDADDPAAPARAPAAGGSCETAA